MVKTVPESDVISPVNLTFFLGLLQTTFDFFMSTLVPLYTIAKVHSRPDTSALNFSDTWEKEAMKIVFEKIGAHSPQQQGGEVVVV